MILERHEVGLSKGKTAGLMAVAAMFVALGVWMATRDSAEIASDRRFNSPIFVHSLGWISTIMGALSGWLVLRKLFDRKPGLILDEKGILDNSSVASPGLIPWEDIAGFDVWTVQKQRMMVVRLVDPGKYILRGGRLRQLVGRISVWMCGSPVTISSNALRIGFDDMLALCNEYLRKHRGLDRRSG